MIYIAVVSIYVLMLLGVSIYESRTIKSDEDFMVAGRGVPVYMLVATLVCTWIGSGSLFGTAGLTFRTRIFGTVVLGRCVGRNSRRLHDRGSRPAHSEVHPDRPA